MRKKKGLALIGYGGMGKQHLKRLENVSEIAVLGVYDIKSAKKQAAKEQGWNIFETWEEVLRDPAVEILILATPNETHAPLAIEAMHHGKEVICEKPATLSVAEFDQVTQAAKETGRHFMVHQNRRWDENYRIIQQLKEEDRLGEIFSVESRVQGSRGIPDDWRRLKENGGGMLYDWGVHLIDRILLLFRETKPVSIFADLSYVLGHEVDDGFRIRLAFKNGARALLEVGTVNFIQTPEWYVCGKIGTAVIEDYELHGRYITLNGKLAKEAQPIETGAGLTKTMAPRNDGSTTEFSLPYVQTDVTDFYRNFVEVIDGHAEPVVKNEEVRQVLHLIELAFQSAATNQVILIESEAE
ncbi:Gfo/Idh/MocA family protein [Listeria costaricensis]|uniref:Gfo/Idh/MocA family protein n=1 Tax=Listeria costaricensis TaxID=2026604 RepID=UPI000C082E4F|nr:Gfo/Idh/MocA family oxidoreductase [Listeria costaricensis]